MQQPLPFLFSASIGIENQLTADEIAMADIVLLAADVKVTGEERFAGKKVVKVATVVNILLYLIK
ncbi:hypothetical protein KAM622c_25580 [Klebsiella quasipneumoniae subsp. quasipneumoniae]|nr:hypothetical protein KAM622c_25580 [Klebsiella quasipneumoniae subsp. quasipneumoniae]